MLHWTLTFIFACIVGYGGGEVLLSRINGMTESQFNKMQSIHAGAISDAPMTVAEGIAYVYNITPADEDSLEFLND